MSSTASPARELTPPAPGAAGAARSALRRLARVRLTGRGTALLCAGVVLAGGGVVLELPDLVGLGAAAVLVVVAAWTVMGVQRLDAGRGALDVTRALSPHPVVRGQTTAVRLEVGARASTGAAYERLARLRLSEQAAHELAGPHGIRARVTAHPDRLSVRYTLEPARRGRWALGPLLTTRTDVFSLARTTQPLGATTHVAVRPRTVELSTRSHVLGDVDRAATGARLASTDDSVLREYVAGDDPRRVHWAGSARQGRLMVRADESAGVRPVTVLLDRSTLPPPPDGRAASRPATHGVRAVDHGERAVELAASVAVAFLEAGRPARLVGSSAGPVATPFSSGAGHGRAAVLDAAVDLRGHRSATAATEAIVSTARSLRLNRTGAEVTVAVLAPQPEAARHELATLAADGTCWAVVLTPRGTADDAARTVADLRQAGWRVAVCDAGTPPAEAWSLLAERVA